MEVKVLNSISFASLSANYELDTNVNLKATNRASYHGLDLTLDECLSAVKDTSINNYSSFYLSNDYDYKDVLSLDKLSLPSNYTFTSYIRLNNDSENTYLASKSAPKQGLTSLYYTSTLGKDAFFEINFLDDVNCKIKHTEGNITRYLTYNYLTTNLSMLTGTDTVEQFDLNTFQYVYDASSDYITFTKKIFDAPHVLTYSSSSTLTLEPSDNNARVFPYLTTQTFKLRENPTTINDLLSTSNYVYKKTLDDRELKVSLDESVYSFNSNFLYNAEYYNINPYKNNNLYVNILNLKNQKTAKNTQSQGGVFLNQPAFKHRYYEDLYTGVNQIKGNYNIGLGYSSYTLAKTLKKDNLNYFHFPYDLYPYEKININDSSLIISGAISSNTPYYSDKIFKKLGDYKYSSNFGDVSDSQTGAFLCSWLSGGDNINDKGTWVDRYYNPSKIGYFDAIQTQTSNITDFETISSLTQNDDVAYDLYDVKSSLTFESGALYAYHHIGNSNCQNFVNSMSGNLIVNNIDQYFTTTYDRIFYKDEINFEHNYFAYVLEEPFNKVSEFNNFSLTFDLSNDDWTKTFGSQIIGNYAQRGFGIFNNEKITPYSVTFNGETIYIFNTKGIILKTINHGVEILSIQRFDPNGIYLVIDKNKKITKYNYIGTILEQTEIDLDLDTNHNFYSYGLNLFVLNNNNWYAINCDSLEIVNISLTEVKIGNAFRSIVVNDSSIYLLPGVNPKIVGNEIYYYTGFKLKYFDINNTSDIKDKVEASVVDYVFDKDGNLYVLYNKDQFAKINNLDKILFNGPLSNFTGFTKSYGKSIDIINEFYKSKHINDELTVVSLSSNDTDYRLCYSRFKNDFTASENFVTNVYTDSLKTFSNNFNVNNYNYIDNNLNDDNTLTCKIKLPSIYNVQSYEHGTLSYSLSNLSPGYHNFTITFDSLNGLFNFYVDGTNVDTYEFTPGSYSFGTLFDNKIYIGTEPSYGNNKLNENLQDVNYYNYGNFKLKDLYMYNTSLDLYEIANIIRTKYNIQDLQFELPTGKRNYVENIDKFFMNKLPGRKSNLFNVRIVDSSIDEKDLQENISKEIESRIGKVLPANTKLNKIIWEKI
tara:strand:+ start:3989 stop:7282 length:3294 start_codon:yes stop_codon:yes gene_type:complete